MPVTAFYGALHFFLRPAHAAAQAVVDAGRVSDDDGRAVIGFGFFDRLHELIRVGAERNLGDVNMTVRHEKAPQVFLVGAAACRGELRHCAYRSRLGRLPARVGIYFRVDEHDIEVMVHRKDVIQTAVTDIVRPAVTAVHPNGLLDDVFLVGEDVIAKLLRPAAYIGLGEGRNISLTEAFRHFPFVLHAERVEPGLRRFGQFTADEGQKLFRLQTQIHALLIHGQGHAERKFRIIFEDRIRPCRAVAVGIRRVGQTRHGGSPCLRTAGRVGNEHALAEELRQDLHVRRFGTTCAGAGEFEKRLVELAALDGELVEGRFLPAERYGKFPIFVFMKLRVERFHDEGFFLRRAGVDAALAAVAVKR